MTNAVLLPAVIEFNLSSNYDKFSYLAKMLGENVELPVSPQKSVEAIVKLSRDIGIPSGLIELGVKEEDIPAMARDCMKIQRLLVNNPRPVTERDMRAIYKKAMRNW